MCQTALTPAWTLTLSHQEIRTISLALVGRIKPNTPEAAEAALLLKAINEQRLSRLNEMTHVLEGLNASLEG